MLALTNFFHLRQKKLWIVIIRLLYKVCWGSGPLTWICEACRSMVMMWSAPATDSMLATSLAEMGARL